LASFSALCKFDILLPLFERCPLEKKALDPPPWLKMDGVDGRGVFSSGPMAENRTEPLRAMSSLLSSGRPLLEIPFEALEGKVSAVVAERECDEFFSGISECCPG
jgi:hypothetical protein